MDKKKESDKVYWHKYIPFYERFLPKNVNKIVEIGVFKGDSIRFWNDRFSEAIVYGVDIIKEQDSWPKSSKNIYFQLDQADTVKYREALKVIGNDIDVFVEDGSHFPEHQKTTLVETIGCIKKGGIYILEDIHTSHKSHPYYKDMVRKKNKNIPFLKNKTKHYFTVLEALLLLEHVKTNNIEIEQVKNRIDFTKSLMTYDELVSIYKKIANVYMYKRTVLPDNCYSCGSNEYDYLSLRCKCGVKLMSECDSMSAVLKF